MREILFILYCLKISTLELTLVIIVSSCDRRPNDIVQQQHMEEKYILPNYKLRILLSKHHARNISIDYV